MSLWRPPEPDIRGVQLVELPHEVLEHIIMFLDYESVQRVAESCLFLRSVVLSSRPLWRVLLLRERPCLSRSSRALLESQGACVRRIFLANHRVQEHWRTGTGKISWLSNRPSALSSRCQMLRQVQAAQAAQRAAPNHLHNTGAVDHAAANAAAAAGAAALFQRPGGNGQQPASPSLPDFSHMSNFSTQAHPMETSHSAPASSQPQQQPAGAHGHQPPLVSVEETTSFQITSLHVRGDTLAAGYSNGAVSRWDLDPCRKKTMTMLVYRSPVRLVHVIHTRVSVYLQSCSPAEAAVLSSVAASQHLEQPIPPTARTMLTFPDGRSEEASIGLASASSSNLTVWDIETGRCHVARLRTGDVTSIASSPCAGIFAAGDQSGTVRVFQITRQNLTCFHVITVSATPITSLAVGSSGQWILSNSNDVCCRLWRSTPMDAFVVVGLWSKRECQRGLVCFSRSEVVADPLKTCSEDECKQLKTMMSDAPGQLPREKEPSHNSPQKCNSIFSRWPFLCKQSRTAPLTNRAVAAATTAPCTFTRILQTASSFFGGAGATSALPTPPTDDVKPMEEQHSPPPHTMQVAESLPNPWTTFHANLVTIPAEPSSELVPEDDFVEDDETLARFEAADQQLALLANCRLFWPGQPSTVGRVTCLAHDKFFIVNGTSAGQVQLWDVATGMLHWSCHQHVSPVKSLQLDSSRLFVGHADGTICYINFDECL
ncbi:hypothetical protein CAOG_005344 [Capsaspora owczarzaki ATCC 30864]|uniref:F-box domain-containing protein n=1 Tax=Capsaspora owczarzaki (strain ATCC 30864) TaxID=595528 RepID=A0A0D2UI17_CAPO3|nr:hypothetical protein CAOG_005344 [Capsaspora owczarzaki ATCC 30864]